MIPRSQHFRDRAPFPFDRSGIMRIFEKPAFEALFLSARGRAHYAGEQPNASVEQGQRGRLRRRRAHSRRPRRGRSAEPRTNARRYPRSDRTGSRRPGRRRARGRRPGSSGSPRGVMASRGASGRCSSTWSTAMARTSARITIPAPAAGRRVVDRAVLVGREVADLNRLERPDAFATSARPARLWPSGPGNISG